MNLFFRKAIFKAFLYNIPPTKVEVLKANGRQSVDTKYFVDFMRDAPEPTGEEVEDTDMELPKIYEPIETFKALEERLKYFLDQLF